ncbi:O-antigen ligase family protein [Sansalvadorimonas sp. 2012CJ34-2]|uniref:O-antigen ligase family protein n=1 Tax=Parendozoicomonas callyspongiae TaxID=2942213 RepID=A0ABT0PM49_9GAMM|nr:O-antigen ligase family protein [Sansalvadorimonas sp. 2012CJ34-2]MCL6272051.1 O-antigen ligase family protein [Sansalvadorimonas sp. 2012CJ34-2]
MAVAPARYSPKWLEQLDFLIKNYLLPFGVFLQLTGMLWIGSNGGYITQTYIWCLFPGLILLTINTYKSKFRFQSKEMTTSEKLIILLFLWIIINPFFTSEALSFNYEINRVLKISLYLYVIRTLVIYSKRVSTEKILFISAIIATAFALITMTHHYGILDKQMGIRALGLGGSGYRIAGLEIGEFADFNNPILASLYYGCFTSIFLGYLLSTLPNKKTWPLAVAGLIILAIFILLSGSRGPLIAFIAMTIVGIFSQEYPLKKYLIITTCIVSGIMFLIFFEEIISQIQYAISDGLNCRVPLWQQTIEYISRAPLYGHGISNSFEATCQGVHFFQPHNIPLNIAYYWGIPAATLYLLVIIYGLKIGLTGRTCFLKRAASLLLIFGFVGMLTDSYSFLVRPDFQWLLFFLPISLLAGIEARLKL